ncbi:hypothetical protein Tco_1512213 [Tanacetum coccineum]
MDQDNGNAAGRTFDARPKPKRQAMWYYCRMHRIRMRHTTDSGVAAAGLRRTTTSGIVGGSLGIGHGIGSITLHEVIDDCMSPPPSGSSED